LEKGVSKGFVSEKDNKKGNLYGIRAN